MTPTVYAIDFGTSNSLLAGANASEVSAPIPLDPSASDPAVFRTIVHFSEESVWSFGAKALPAYVAASMRGRLLRSIKRFLPMRSFVQTTLGRRSVKLEELVGIFLREMRTRANEHFGADVKNVLLGRPARFSLDEEDDELAESRLAQAALFAGFENIAFCPEPEAAAFDYRRGMSSTCTVLVADLGGGTSDYTVVRFHDDGRTEVLATYGVPLAGDAVDGTIMRHKVSRHFGAEVTYKVPFGSNTLSMPKSIVERLCVPADLCLLSRRDVVAFLKDVRAWSLGPEDENAIDQLLVLIDDALGFQVFEEIESTKRTLSFAPDAKFAFTYPGIEISEHVTRDAFDDGSKNVLARILSGVDTTLELAKIAPSEIDRVCVTGGTARLPRVADFLRERFGSEKLHQLSSFQSVISGLAERARHLASEGILKA
jgi:hypothetical chaperone protein